MDTILSLVALKVLAEVLRNGNERERNTAGGNRGRNDTTTGQRREPSVSRLSSITDVGMGVLCAPRTLEEEEAQLQTALASSMKSAEQERSAQNDEKCPRSTLRVCLRLSGGPHSTEDNKSSANTPNSKSATAQAAEPPIVKCPVCLAQDKQVVRLGIFTTRCGHVICGACVDQLQRFNNKCPICRVEVRREEMVKTHLHS